MRSSGLLRRFAFFSFLLCLTPGATALAGPAGQETTADTIRGVVRDRRFEPVVNARVQLVQVWPERSLTGEEQRPATTDRNGAFALRFSSREDCGLVRIMAPDHAPVLVWGTPAKPLQVLLPRSIPVTVKVIDEETKKPVPNATVRTFLLGWSATHDGIAFEEVTTGPDGTARVCLAQGEATVVASAPDFAPAAMELEVRVGTNEIVVALDTGATLRGQVRGPNGQPVAGVEVTATAEPCYHATRRTDDTGGFLFTHVPQGKNLTPC
jgi:hypothetical protein